ncbi:MAG: HEAT repeat domain-containing protein [Planctomycetes bacterium]|nr:HEAT repeat domain-containing protein [Planctomycetota bacterium]
MSHRTFCRALLALAVLAAPLAADEIPADLKREYQDAFRSRDAATRLAVVETAAARGDEAGARLLVEILARKDSSEERDLFARRARVQSEIDAIFERAIRDRRMLTKEEDAGLQGVKANQAAIDREIDALVEVRWRAAEALTGFDGSAARAYLIGEALEHEDWFVRWAAARALGGEGEPDPVAALIRRLKEDTSPQVITAALDALAARKASVACGDVAGALSSEHWPVRAAAASCLAALGDLRGVKPLIDRLEKEDGRLRTDLDLALKALTGFSFDGDHARWESWWKVHGQAIELGNFVRGAGEGAGQQVTGVNFYGVRTLSNRVVFVLDTSGSMKEKAGKPVPVTGDSGRVVLPEGDTKFDVARAQLKTALLALPEGAEFNIVFYRQGVSILSPSMVRVNRANLDRAFQFIDGHRAAGGTNIFDALHRALNLVETGDSGARITRRNYEALVDTIFILSDGEPNYGRFKDREGMIREISRLNGCRKVVIHAIGIGRHDKEFMKALAGATGGEYAAYE